MQAIQERMRQQEPLDITEIVRDLYDVVFRFCVRRVGPDHAADAAQETFITAHRAAKKFRGASSVKTWVLGIAVNECHRQRRKNRIERPDLNLTEGAAPDMEQPLIDRHVLEEALNKLSPEHKEVVLMHEVDGLTYEEISGVLRIPVGTVKSRLHHAFLNMRRALRAPDGGEL